MNWELAFGLCLFAVMSVGVALLVAWNVRQSVRASKLLSDERQRTWYATVTGSETREIVIQKAKRRHMTVFYLRDDETQGNVQAYDGDGLKWAYTGALAYYKNGPSYEVLQTWNVGDRLFKASGQDFPSKV